jgi:hypothetical protein
MWPGESPVPAPMWAGSEPSPGNPRRCGSSRPSPSVDAAVIRSNHSCADANVARTGYSTKSRATACTSVRDAAIPGHGGALPQRQRRRRRTLAGTTVRSRIDVPLRPMTSASGRVNWKHSAHIWLHRCIVYIHTLCMYLHGTVYVYTHVYVCACVCGCVSLCFVRVCFGRVCCMPVGGCVRALALVLASERRYQRYP